MCRKLGGLSLGFVAIELAVSIALMTWLGRRFGLPPKMTSLLAIGSSICGVSAIIAAKGAIEARGVEGRILRDGRDPGAGRI